jgi:hypothetical protein
MIQPLSGSPTTSLCLNAPMSATLISRRNVLGRGVRGRNAAPSPRRTTSTMFTGNNSSFVHTCSAFRLSPSETSPKTTESYLFPVTQRHTLSRPGLEFGSQPIHVWNLRIHKVLYRFARTITRVKTRPSKFYNEPLSVRSRHTIE